MKVLRTPEERFEDLLVIEDLRIHYVDEGPELARVVPDLTAETPRGDE